LAGAAGIETNTDNSLIDLNGKTIEINGIKYELKKINK
jgi:hypothetical protein